jgi:cytochrome P450
LDPFSVFNQLRNENPVWYDASRNCWDVFKYEDVHRVLKDPRGFSSARGSNANQNLLFMDPPKHHQLRDLVNKAFTPRAIQELARRIQEIAEELLGEVTDNETTTNLITNGVRLLTEQPQQKELLNETEAIPSFIEEVLRFYPPIVAIGRIATEETHIRTSTIRAGEQVIAWVGAANRDELKFPDPDVFNLRRKPNPHLSFGFGIHFCLGAPLARLEGHIAIETLLKHFENLKRVPGSRITPIQSSFVFGLKSYPVAFSRK